MEIQNLHEGQEVKNYKELCNTLGIVAKGGNSKKIQHKEFERYFKYEKQGHKYIIKEIYKQPKEKIDKRTEGNNSIFSDDIKHLIVYMLHKDRSESMLMSKGAMYKAMNLVNENYLMARNNISKLSEIIELPQSTIHEFYDYNSPKLRDTLERNLKRCRSRSLLFYESVIVVVTYETKIATNELGQPIVDSNGKLIYDTQLVHREATHEEKQIILRFENEVKGDMGIDDNQEIFIRKKWGHYKKEVEFKLKQAHTNIQYYYDAYKITWNNDRIDDEYKLLDTRIKENDLKSNINNNMVHSINNATTKRHHKVKKQFLIEGSKYKQEKILRQKSETYISDHERLTSILIDETAKSLKEEFNKPINTKKYNQINESSEQLEWNSVVPF